LERGARIRKGLRGAPVGWQDREVGPGREVRQRLLEEDGEEQAELVAGHGTLGAVAHVELEELVPGVAAVVEAREAEHVAQPELEHQAPRDHESRVAALFDEHAVGRNRLVVVQVIHAETGLTHQGDDVGQDEAQPEVGRGLHEEGFGAGVDAEVDGRLPLQDGHAGSEADHQNVAALVKSELHTQHTTHGVAAHVRGEATEHRELALLAGELMR